MITNRSLRFALCALLLLAPLAALSAQEMDDAMMGNDEGFYITAAYAATMPITREISDDDNTVDFGTELGFLGGRFGVGYGVAGFRPEVSVGYRSAAVDSLTVTKSNLPLSLASLNKAIADADISSTISSIDLAANVYYDVTAAGSFSLYLGVGGGMSLITVKMEPAAGLDYSDSATALSFQAAAGIGYDVMEDLTLTLGYRLVGTTEAKFNKYDTTKTKTAMTLSHNVEAGLRFSF